MRGVGRGAVADDLGERLRAARSSVLERLQDEHARTLADDEAVAPFVERPRGALRIVVAGGEGAHRREAAHQRLVAGSLGPAGEHHVGVAAPDRLPGLADGVAARGAGGHDAEVGALRAEDDGDHAGRQVADGHGDQERRHAVRALLAHQQDLLGQGADPADARPDDDAGPLGQLAFQPAGQAGLVHRLARRHERELDVAVGAALLLAVEDDGSKSLTSAAIRVVRRDGSNWVMGPTPDLPAIRPAQVDGTSLPSGVMAPMPVTTTRAGAVLSELIELASLCGWWRRDKRRRAGRAPRRRSRLP